MSRSCRSGSRPGRAKRLVRGPAVCDEPARPPGVSSALNLLDRYIFKSVLFTCLAAVGLFAFVLIVGNALKELLGYALAGQLPLTTVVQLVALLVPYVFMYALPMGILTGVLLTLGRLSADSEVTAMRSAGLSLARIARPVLLLGVLGLVLGLYVNFEFMPRARTRYYTLLAREISGNPLGVIVPKTFVRDFPGFVVYIGDKVDLGGDAGTVLQDFWLWQLDHEKRVTGIVHAHSGRIEYEAETNDFILTLQQAQVETRDAKTPEDFSTSPRVASFQSTPEPVRLSLDRLFGRGARRDKLDWRTYDELKAHAARLAARTVPPGQARAHELAQFKIKLTVQDKFTTAMSVFAFALIGVPLGIKASRRETSANLGLALVLVLSYYFLTVMVKWLDQRPELRPDLLLWLPNLAMIGLALWLFRRVERRA